MPLTATHPLSATSDPFLVAPSTTHIPIDPHTSSKKTNIFAPTPEAILRAAHGRQKFSFGLMGNPMMLGGKGGKERPGMGVNDREKGTPTSKYTARRPTVSFSPHTRHHPYDPELRVSHINIISKSDMSKSTPRSNNVNATNATHAANKLSSASPPTRSAQPGSQMFLSSKTTPLTSSNPLRELVPTPQPSPSSTTTSTPPTASAEPHRPRSILKHHPNLLIRVVGSVEEGTRGNAAESRRVDLSFGLGNGGGPEEEERGEVGRRPGLVAKDSFLVEIGKGKGKARMVMRGEKAEGSDAGAGGMRGDGEAGSSRFASEQGQANVGPAGDTDIGQSTDSGNNDGPPPPSTPEIEMVDVSTSPNSIDSLLAIICHEPNDLLSIEDAYNTLFFRLRKVFCAPVGGAPPTECQAAEIVLVTRLFGENKDGLYWALKRDVERLVGLPPNMVPFVGPPSPPSSPSGPSSSASRGGAASSDSSSPLRPSDASPKPKRQGYSAAEVRNRRAGAGCGQSALKVLAFVFNRSELFNAFSEEEIVDILKAILVIPATPKLFTPNSKKTYPLAIYVFAHVRIPITCLSPVVEEVLYAITQAVGEAGNSLWGGGPSKREGEGGNVKARSEGFSAMSNLCNLYPSLFLYHHAVLIPPALRALSNGVQQVKNRGAIAIGGMVKGRMFWAKEAESRMVELAERSDEEEDIVLKRQDALREWESALEVGKEMGLTALKALKSLASPAVINTRDNTLEREFGVLRRTLAINFRTAPHWASTAWANVTSLLGVCYTHNEPEFAVYKFWNETLIDSLQYPTKTPSLAQFALSRLAWNHAVHILIAGKASPVVIDGRPMIRYRLSSAMSPVTIGSVFTVMLEGLRPSQQAAAELVLSSTPDDEEEHTWIRKDSLAEQDHIRLCCGSGISALQSYIAVIKASQALTMAESGTLSDDHLDTLFDGPVSTLLNYMLGVEALDDVKVQGWDLLRSILRQDDAETSVRRPERSLQEGMLSGDLLATEISNVNREGNLFQLAQRLVGREVKPVDLPGWGSDWVRGKIGSLVGKFANALRGLDGISDADAVGQWANDVEGRRVMPITLEEIWRLLLSTLADCRASHPESFQAGYESVIRCLADVLNDKTSSHRRPLPRHSSTALNNHFRLFQHLWAMTVSALTTDVVVNTRLRPKSLDTNRNASTELFEDHFGTDRNGHVTAAGLLLAHMGRSASEDKQLGEGLSDIVAVLITRLVKLGTAATGAHRFLGDLTNALPILGQRSPKVERALWESLCEEWTAVIAKGSVSTKPAQPTSNRTGGLLLELLSWPFKPEVTTWHAHGQDLPVTLWKDLFNTAILRCAEKGQSYDDEVIPQVCLVLRGPVLDKSHPLQEAALSCLCAALDASLANQAEASWGPGIKSALLVFGEAMESSRMGELASRTDIVSAAIRQLFGPERDHQARTLVQLLGTFLSSFFDNNAPAARTMLDVVAERVVSSFATCGCISDDDIEGLLAIHTFLDNGAMTTNDLAERFQTALAAIEPERLRKVGLPEALLKAVDESRLAQAVVVQRQERTERAELDTPEVVSVTPQAQAVMEETVATPATPRPLAETDTTRDAEVIQEPIAASVVTSPVKSDAKDARSRDEAMDDSTSSSQYDSAGDVAFAEDDSLPTASGQASTSGEPASQSSTRTGKGKRPRASASSGEPSRKRRRNNRALSSTPAGDEEELRDCIIVASPTVEPTRTLAKSSSTGMLAAVKGWLPAMTFWSPSRGEFELLEEMPDDDEPSSVAGVDKDEDAGSAVTDDAPASSQREVIVDVPTKAAIKGKTDRRRASSSQSSQPSQTRKRGAVDAGRRTRKVATLPGPVRASSPASRPSTKRRSGPATSECAILDLLRQVDAAKDSMDDLSPAQLRETFALLEGLRDKHHKVVSSRL